MVELCLATPDTISPFFWRLVQGLIHPQHPLNQTNKPPAKSSSSKSFELYNASQRTWKYLGCTSTQSAGTVPHTVYLAPSTQRGALPTSHAVPVLLSTTQRRGSFTPINPAPLPLSKHLFYRSLPVHPVPSAFAHLQPFPHSFLSSLVLVCICTGC